MIPVYLRDTPLAGILYSGGPQRLAFPSKHALLAITTSRAHGPIAFLVPPGVIEDTEKSTAPSDEVKLLVLSLQSQMVWGSDRSDGTTNGFTAPPNPRVITSVFCVNGESMGDIYRRALDAFAIPAPRVSLSHGDTTPRPTLLVRLKLPSDTNTGAAPVPIWSCIALTVPVIVLVEALADQDECLQLFVPFGAGVVEEVMSPTRLLSTLSTPSAPSSVTSAPNSSSVSSAVHSQSTSPDEPNTATVDSRGTTTSGGEITVTSGSTPLQNVHSEARHYHRGPTISLNSTADGDGTTPPSPVTLIPRGGGRDDGEGGAIPPFSLEQSNAAGGAVQPAFAALLSPTNHAFAPYDTSTANFLPGGMGFYSPASFYGGAAAQTPFGFVPPGSDAYFNTDPAYVAQMQQIQQQQMYTTMLQMMYNCSITGSPFGAGAIDGSGGGGGGWTPAPDGEAENQFTPRREGRRPVASSEAWRLRSPLAFASGGFVTPLPMAALPVIARASPVKDVEEVMPALEGGVEALREFLTPLPRLVDPSSMGEVSPKELGSHPDWTSSTRLARMHSALDYILRTTHSSSKRAQGGSGVARVDTNDARAIALQNKADETQRLKLFHDGVTPLLVDIIELVSANESRQVLEDAIQCISNIAYSEVIQKRIGGLRIIAVITSRLAADGPSCAEIAIKAARALSTLFWQSTAAFKVAIQTHVPAVTTCVLGAHLSLPFATTKLLKLLAILSHSTGAPQQMYDMGLPEHMALIRQQPWFIQITGQSGHGRKAHILADLDRLGELEQHSWDGSGSG